ncbi:hypothetical protein I6N95_19910 [Vagococcus sp. BWB3-3]|uniref:Uncharacterized protein n=1 Tax=Vagococcus allomyrinae TaxID=2794353 RepID=A0A940PBY4_9ENTE|nr:hypothetical protein [Vagococcus allomyrinae]MBP1043291.1 hypothetical protein [Vagococcus allomyrinae]
MSKLNMNRQRNRKQVIATTTYQSKQAQSIKNVKKLQSDFIRKMTKK